MRDVLAELQTCTSLDCGVVAVDSAEVTGAIRAAAAGLLRESLDAHTPPVVVACACRNAAHRILTSFPPHWTVAQVLAALEQAPYSGGAA